MKSLLLFAGLQALVPLVESHYVFVRLSLNNHWFSPLQYIRNHSTTHTEPFDSTIHYPDGSTLHEGFVRQYSDPTYPQDSAESLRCGRGSNAYAATTSTLAVKGGDAVGWASVILPPRYWTTGLFEGCAGVCGSTGPFHAGPVQSYLSPVPHGTDIRAYDGSGPWIKIRSVGLNPKNASVDWLGSSLYHKAATTPTLTIPPSTPPGLYLLRLEATYPRALPNYAQFYTACAHIRVTGSTNSTPSQLPTGIRIPDDVPWNHPGLSISREMEDGRRVDAGFVYPGGELWDGE